ncbi:hypothetical protein C882_2555 [Caenispirillum salinarum AK4]|uniref:MFS transporter permease n=1 Tax=Caenispirillum salinarum AK4 TaxID=1238182 RepID=K9HW71_9PROT|nr:DUF6064 family protein [Caenispirillum salinarum]EKV32476.1 hypothetical protein C882_2555 [Caenispirillum salinarum AK4]
MEDLLGYSLRDMLLFSRETYVRLFTLTNQAHWPLPIIAGLAGLAGLWLMRGRRVWHGRVLLALTGAGWLWTGWVFLIQRYGTINWAAPWAGYAFLAEGALLLALAITGRRPRTDRRDAAAGAAWALLAAAVLVLPLVYPLLDGQWMRAAPFGIAPDATAAGTLAVLALIRGGWAALAVPVPMAWLAASAVTHDLLGMTAVAVGLGLAALAGLAVRVAAARGLSG